jgi:hypothetical protein
MQNQQTEGIAMRILLSFYAATVIVYVLANSTTGGAQSLFGILTLLLSFSSVLISIATLSTWCDEQEAKRNEMAERSMNA